MSQFLENLRVSAHAYEIPIISSNTESFIRDFLPSLDITYGIEIWSCISYSTSVIAQSIQKTWWQLATFEISYPHYQQGLYVIWTLKLNNVTNYYWNFLNIDLDKCLHRKLDFAFIDGRKSEYHLYLQKIIPFLADNYCIICDDVIKFSKKLTPLYNFLEKNQIKYTIHKLDDDDGIMIIHNDAWLIKLTDFTT